MATFTWIVSCPEIDRYSCVWYSVGANLNSIDIFGIVRDTNRTEGVIESALFTLLCLKVDTITCFLQKRGHNS